VPTRPVPSGRVLSRSLGILAAVVLLAGLLVPAAPVGASATTGARCGGLARVCTFDDEFTGSVLNRSLWTVQTTAQFGFHSGAECLVDTPQNVAVANGRLSLTVRKAAAPFTCRSPKSPYRTAWTGASVYTRAFGQTYGRFEIRARFPEARGVPGLQSALWMYPRSMASPRAASGVTEIDVAEAYSRYRDWVSPTVHTLLGGRSVSCELSDYGAGFHTYTVEWSKRAAFFYYDGVQCMRVNGAGSSQPFLLALSQVLGVTPNLSTAATPQAATMQVDYVRVWK
jgi:beta-glucanase (GH16 family)